jgi:cysteine desulfurase
VSRAYLDHASTSPTRPAAIEAMLRLLRPEATAPLGDPGRIHAEGMAARVALETAREQVAQLVGARPREVVLTSGATEAIAAASYGAFEKEGTGRHTVVTAVEHSAVREWAARGEATVVGVDRHGRVDPDEVLAAVREDTAIVHVQWGNHEVGTLQPVEEVVSRCRERGTLIHVDAAQAVGRVPVDFRSLGADLMSVSGHKFGGPAGTGALLVRRGVRLPALLLGGDQERARRAGMENVPALVGMGAAAEQLLETLTVERRRSLELTSRVVAWAAASDDCDVLGDPQNRLPHLVCIGIRGVEPQPVLLGLDRLGIAVHSGSSCSSESIEPSPVLEAMGVDAERSLRISVGWDTSTDDVDRLTAALPKVISSLRSLGRNA